MSKREDLERLLKAEVPDGDFSDDEKLYEQVINDYVDYARLLEMEQGQAQAIADAEERGRKAALEENEKAIAEAELRGRNAAIAEQMTKTELSDGIPHLGGGGTTKTKRTSYFDLARL